MILSTRAEISFRTSKSVLTSDLGRYLGSGGLAGTLIILTGPMGIGKTEWGRGVAEGLGISGRIVSPTFLYVQQYESSFDSPAPGFLHADWDRVTNGAEDLEESLLDGMEKRITLVEWGEKLPDSVKESFPMIVHVALSWDGDGRRIQMAWRSSRSFEGPLLKWQSGFGSCIRKLEGVQAV